MEQLKIFVGRLEKAGIKVELFSNFPWIYLDKINGKRVSEKFQAEHGFTVAFHKTRADNEFTFTDITEIFKLIRKYMNKRTFKTITHVFAQDGSNVTKVIGIYAPDKIQEGLDDTKKIMQADGKVLIKEDRDCCNSFLEYEGGDHIYTGDFVLNELNF